MNPPMKRNIDKNEQQQRKMLVENIKTFTHASIFSRANPALLIFSESLNLQVVCVPLYNCYHQGQKIYALEQTCEVSSRGISGLEDSEDREWIRPLHAHTSLWRKSSMLLISATGDDWWGLHANPFELVFLKILHVLLSNEAGWLFLSMLWKQGKTSSFSWSHLWR